MGTTCGWPGVSMCCGEKELDVDGLSVFPISVDMVFRYEGFKTFLIYFEDNRTS